MIAGRVVRLALFMAIVVLAGCTQSPGEQCLESFRSNLKDPESGKVIAFKENVLTYTATNSYGARTQGKAICKQGSDSKWRRDHMDEYLEALQYVKNVADELTSCSDAHNGDKEPCIKGNPIARGLLARKSPDELATEAMSILGFR